MTQNRPWLIEVKSKLYDEHGLTHYELRSAARAELGDGYFRLWDADGELDFQVPDSAWLTAIPLDGAIPWDQAWPNTHLLPDPPYAPFDPSLVAGKRAEWLAIYG